MTEQTETTASLERDIRAMIRRAYPIAVSADGMANLLNEPPGRIVNILNEMAARKVVESTTTSDGRVLWREAHLP